MVGEAPDEIDQAMGQRGRWAQGAVEMLLQRCCPRRDRRLTDPAFARIPHELSDHITMLTAPPKLSFLRLFLLHTVYFDSMVYPLSSLGALCFWLMSSLYLVFNASPIMPECMRTFLIMWLPLLMLKFFCTMKAYPHVSVFTLWRAQQAWFAYSLAIVKATLDALKGYAFPRLQNGWFNTGAKRKGIRASKYYPASLVICTLGFMCYRTLATVFTVVPTYWSRSLTATLKPPRLWETMSSQIFGICVLYLLKDWAWESLPGDEVLKIEHDSSQLEEQNVSDKGKACATYDFEQLLQRMDNNFRTGRLRYPSRLLQVLTLVACGALVNYIWSSDCTHGPTGVECYNR